MRHKALDTLVQMVVVLALYVPILFGARWWQRRKMRGVLSSLSGPRPKCMCGKWALPGSINVETHGLSGEIPPAPTMVNFTCPMCGHATGRHLMPSMLTSRPKLSLVGLADTTGPQPMVVDR
jgi:hypothetical protein